MAQVPIDMVAFDGETNVMNRFSGDGDRKRRNTVVGLRGAGLSADDRARRIGKMRYQVRRGSANVVANPLNAAKSGASTESKHSADNGEQFSTSVAPEPSDLDERLAAAGFLICGIGIATTWICIQSGLTYYQTVFPAGEGIYYLLLVAYNTPVLPLLIAQASLDRQFDSQFGTSQAVLTRFSSAFVVLAACLLVAPFVGQGGLLAISCVVGVFDSVGYGTASQLFAIFPASAGGLYFIGASVASIVSIVIAYATGFATDPTQDKMIIVFCLSAAVVLIAFCVTLYLVLGPSGQYYIALKDYDGGDGGDAGGGAAAAGSTRTLVASPEPLSEGGPTGTGKSLAALDLDADAESGRGNGAAVVESNSQSPSTTGSPAVVVAGSASPTSSAGGDPLPVRGGGAADMGSEARDKSMVELFVLTWPAQVALAMTLFTGVLTGSLIGFVPSYNDKDGEKDSGFATLLLYVGMVAGLVGKQLNVARRGYFLRTQEHLLMATGAQLVSSAFFLTYVLAQPFRSNVVVIIERGLQGMFGAYFSSLAYGMATQLLDSPADRAYTSTILSVMLMLGVFAGLGVSFGVAAAVPG